MKINNSYILIGLVLLTIGSYLFSEQTGVAGRPVWLLLFALLKVLLVAIYFMELRIAHRTWLVILGAVLLVFAGFVFVLQP